MSICRSDCMSIKLSVNLSIFLSVCPSFYQSVHLFISLSIFLSVCPSFYHSVHLFISLSIILSVCTSINLSISLCIYWSIHQSVYLFICLSIFPSIYRGKVRRIIDDQVFMLVSMVHQPGHFVNNFAQLHSKVGQIRKSLERQWLLYYTECGGLRKIAKY